MPKKLIVLFLVLYIHHLQAQNPSFKQIVLWGHKLHSHTHSYIHYAFERAFKHLGYKTLWLDKNDSTSSIDFSDSLFITEGQVDQNIPLRNDCRYILHNCEREKYQHLFDQGLCIIIQVYTHDCLKRQEAKIDDCMHINLGLKTIYMPWATDLLPHEIDQMKKQAHHKNKRNTIYWIGSIWDGIHGNREQLAPFQRACTESKIEFKHAGYISADQNIDFIQQSLMAPAIQGKWQCENGYIPCRIFKNISYGQMGITNSKAVYNLFKGKVIYNENTYQLFFDAKKRLEHMNINELYDLMDFVKQKHTYLNRIDHLFDFLHLMKPLPNYTPKHPMN